MTRGNSILTGKTDAVIFFIKQILSGERIYYAFENYRTVERRRANILSKT